jgi:aquaporin Z
MSSESVQGGTAGESGEVGELAQHAEQRVVSILEDFQDPSREWRRLFSELLGTFFLVLVAAGGGVMGRPSWRPG